MQIAFSCFIFAIEIREEPRSSPFFVFSLDFQAKKFGFRKNFFLENSNFLLTQKFESKRRKNFSVDSENEPKISVPES